MLKMSWNRCWTALNAKGDGLLVMQELVAAYSEPHRKYHTLQHLTECLSLLDKNLDLAVKPAEVEMSLWFHDAIYSLRSSDNEEKSAEWAGVELGLAAVDPQSIQRIKQHILATRHVALPTGQDEMLLVDIDLAILGAPRPRYEEFEAQVRAEYGWVPGFLFRRKRRTILADFLARATIYNTPRLRDAFEHQARENLAYSLQQLGK